MVIISILTIIAMLLGFYIVFGFMLFISFFFALPQNARKGVQIAQYYIIKNWAVLYSKTKLDINFITQDIEDKALVPYIQNFVIYLRTYKGEI